MTIGLTRAGGPILELSEVVKRFGAGTTEMCALTDVNLAV